MTDNCESIEVRSVAELDDFVRRGIIRDDDATRIARNNLALREQLAANPSLVHVHRPMTVEEIAQAEQEFRNDCKARGVEPKFVSMNLSGGVIALGNDGEIVAKDGHAVLPASSGAEN